VQALLVALGHTIAAWAGFALLSVPGAFAVIWPATGFLLGALLILPSRSWLTVAGACWISATLLQKWIGVRLTVGAPLSGLGVAEALAGAWLLMRWRPTIVQFRTASDMFALTGIGALVAAVGGLIGAFIVHSVGPSNGPQYIWTVWASGHIVGILLFAPVWLMWHRPSVPNLGSAGAMRVLEGVVVFGLLIGVSTLVFLDGIPPIEAPTLLSEPYQVLPFAVLIAVRFGVRGAVAAMVITSIMAVAGTAVGGQAFALTHPLMTDRVVIIQGYTATLTLVSVLLGIAMEQAYWQDFQTRLLNEALAEANGVLVHEIGERERTALSLRMLLDATPEGIVVVDEQGLIVEVNSALEWMFGYTRGQLIGQPGEMLVADADKDTVQAYRLRYAASPDDLATRGAGQDLEAVRSDGKTFAAQVGLSPYRLGEQLRIIATIRDVTEQRAADRRMETSLREKEVLLREVHHRVKNNMAVMSSLFYLQQRYATDADTIRVFRESESRVRSMAMVHEVLYRSSDLSAVDFSRYLASLVEHLANVYRGTLPGLQLELDIEAIRLSLDQAVPCGLLLNEVLTNAFKHAFVDGAPAALRVHARATDAEVLIEIVDNGVGVPETLAPERTQTLGMRLMQALTEQLDGSLTTERQERGTRTRLLFPRRAAEAGNDTRDQALDGAEMHDGASA
jgi:PAS domain S-box-containing protein